MKDIIIDDTMFVIAVYQDIEQCEHCRKQTKGYKVIANSDGKNQSNICDECIGKIPCAIEYAENCYYD